MIDDHGATPEENAGRELRRLREARNWSQEFVARRMDAYGYDWHQTTVAKTESAIRPLRLNELADLCDLLGITPATLLLRMQGETDDDLERKASARAAELEDQLARIRAVLDDGHPGPSR